ncbi:hypothetical protein [Burkholderia ubonensis]|uniref:hypothetical protein n=1 Tax=Burkholderia ubonensis TaxID=101571 RepID=UPI001E41271B|nr:hypothetical protein [Burkholderia ubonensis]
MRGMSSAGRQRGAELRHPAPNRHDLLWRDMSTKAGVKIRRLKAATSDPYRAELLGW